jgi:hypothetical protein
VNAYREGTLPFPEATVLAKLAWKHAPLAGLDGAFLTGPATTVQIMVMDSERYPGTDGWRFGRFINGKPTDDAQQETRFPCHEHTHGGYDFVFTRFAL